MSRAAAKAFYTQQIGDPDAGYITPADAQAAIDMMYDDLASVTRSISTGTGLTGGGDLTDDRTLEIAAGGVGTTQLADAAVTPIKLSGAYGAKTASYTVTASDQVVVFDTTSAACTATLPAASGMTGKTLRIIKSGGANTLTVTRSGSDTLLPGAKASLQFPAAASHGEVMLVSSGTSWHVVSGQASSELAGSRMWRWEQALASTSTAATVGWRPVGAISGTGSPLGVITPERVGQHYVDEAQTLGAREWVATGTTAASWLVVNGDTGWMSFASALQGGWAAYDAPRVAVRRFGASVSIIMELNAAAATADLIWSLPSGWRPTWQHNVPVYDAAAATSSASINVIATGAVTWRGTRASARNAHGVWHTSDPWPTAAPA